MVNDSKIIITSRRDKDMNHVPEQVDKSYLELDLPEYLQHSIKQWLEGQQKVAAGENYFGYDMDWDELNADIGIARSNEEITERQAEYLRNKYLY